MAHLDGATIQVAVEIEATVQHAPSSFAMASSIPIKTNCTWTWSLFASTNSVLSGGIASKIGKAAEKRSLLAKKEHCPCLQCLSSRVP
jgi:hypothetical protein